MESLGVKYQFVELRARGLSFQKISLELGVSKKTLLNWSKELTLEVKNARQLIKDQYLERIMEKEAERAETLLSAYGKALKAFDEIDYSKSSIKDILALLSYLENKIGELKVVELTGYNQEPLDLDKLFSLSSWVS